VDDDNEQGEQDEQMEPKQHEEGAEAESILDISEGDEARTSGNGDEDDDRLLHEECGECGSTGTGEVNEEATDAEMRGENNGEGEQPIDRSFRSLSPTFAFFTGHSKSPFIH
jgi:hypothetical protein